MGESVEVLRAFGDLMQRRLFPAVEEELGAMDGKEREFVRLCAAAWPFFPAREFAWAGNGKPPVPRWNYFRAFLAKAVWDFGPTSALVDELRSRPALRRLCGFGAVPSRSEFSRVFSAFAERETAQRVFAAFTAESMKGAVIHHLSIDSMAVHARESAAPERLAEIRAAKEGACRRRPLVGRDRGAGRDAPRPAAGPGRGREPPRPPDVLRQRRQEHMKGDTLHIWL